jgi:hypothetical protein
MQKYLEEVDNEIAAAQLLLHSTPELHSSQNSRSSSESSSSSNLSLYSLPIPRRKPTRKVNKCVSITACTLVEFNASFPTDILLNRGVVGRELPVVEREEVREEIEMAYLFLIHS